MNGQGLTLRDISDVNISATPTDEMLLIYNSADQKFRTRVLVATDMPSNVVSNTVTLTTTAPLTGGGDLSANRTLAISAATQSVAGSLSAADKTKLDGITATKIYTALLTEVAPAAITSGLLVVGMRYTLTTFVAGDDFLNVGAALNQTGQIFIATGITPTVYANGSTLTSDGAPMATVLENTLGGTVVWSYVEGVYTGTLTGAFTVNKAVILCAASITAAKLIAADTPDANTVRVLTFSSGSAADNILNKTALRIQVFP